MNLYSYTLRFDDGAAPNPYGGVCTLAICKPGIRKTAKVGDWVVGLGSKNSNGVDRSNQVIYAMRVSRTMTLADYFHHCRLSLPSKVPDWRAEAPFEHQVGDCLYQLGSEGKLIQALPGVHNAEENRKIDESGRNVLLAEEIFFYFGDNPVELLPQFNRMCHPTQGYKVHANNEIKEDMVTWMLGNFDGKRKPRILYGRPIDRHLIQPASCSASPCAMARLTDDDGPIC